MSSMFSDDWSLPLPLFTGTNPAGSPSTEEERHMTVDVEVDSIEEQDIEAHRAHVADAVDKLDAARDAIERARAALEAAEALAIVLADQRDDRYDEFSLDLGTDRLVTELNAIGRLARV